MPYQVPGLALPYPYQNVTNIETVADTLTHVSTDLVNLEHMKKKTAIVWAIEAVVLGIPGPLNCWVELSPFPTSVTTAFFGAIGGGGGPSYPTVPAMAPVSPTIEGGTGVNNAVHVIMLSWTTPFMPYARVIVQTPVAVATAVWGVQVWWVGGD